MFEAILLVSFEYMYPEFINSAVLKDRSEEAVQRCYGNLVCGYRRPAYVSETTAKKIGLDESILDVLRVGKVGTTTQLKTNDYLKRRYFLEIKQI
jgi:hypothetical protein